jgi:hypothetical protein
MKASVPVTDGSSVQHDRPCDAVIWATNTPFQAPVLGPIIGFETDSSACQFERLSILSFISLPLVVKEHNCERQRERER